MKPLILIIFSAAAFAQTRVDYIQQVRNKPLRDVRNFGAVCDGLTSVATAAAAAIAAGGTNLFLPKNCVWTFTSSSNWTTPAGIAIIGEDPTLSLLQTDSNTTKILSTGSKAILKNVAIKDSFCYSQVIPVNMIKTCSLDVWINSSDISVAPAPWQKMGYLMNLGPTLQAEPAKNVTNAVNNGSGLIRITVSAHGYSTGDKVVIQNVGGVTNANRITTGSSDNFPLAWQITVIDANTFDLQGSTFAGSYTSGGTAYRAGNDVPGSGFRQNSLGDGIFASITGGGIGVHLQVNGLDVGAAPNNSAGVGIQAEVLTGTKGSGGYFWSQTGATAGIALNIERDVGTGLCVQDGGLSGDGVTSGCPTAQGNAIDIQTGTRTTGQMINLAQGQTTFSGTGIFMNFGLTGGSFTGLYESYGVNGTVQWTVGTASTSWKFVPLKATTGTRYLCIDINGVISSSGSACSGT